MLLKRGHYPTFMQSIPMLTWCWCEIDGEEKILRIVCEKFTLCKIGAGLKWDAHQGFELLA